jgi:hypothetical protein
MLLSGCGSSSNPGSEAASSTPSSPLSCSPASATATDAVAQGLTVQGGGALENPQTVPIPPDKQNTNGWPVQFLGAGTTGPGMDGSENVGVWATGADGAGPIWALNSYAQAFSEWGAAAQPGSKAAENRDLLASYEEAKIVAKCAKG